MSGLDGSADLDASGRRRRARADASRADRATGSQRSRGRGRACDPSRESTMRVHERGNAGPMSQDWKRWTDRLEPLLVRIERLLDDWIGREPGPDLLERHTALRWRSRRGIERLEPIAAVSDFDLDDLIGVDRAVEALDRNTRQLLAGLPCNDVLL